MDADFLLRRYNNQEGSVRELLQEIINILGDKFLLPCLAKHDRLASLPIKHPYEIRRYPPRICY